MAYGESPEASLASVQAAIEKCLLAQRSGKGNRQLELANLKHLREMEKELKAEIAAANAASSGGSKVVYAQRRRPL